MVQCHVEDVPFNSSLDVLKKDIYEVPLWIW